MSLVANSLYLVLNYLRNERGENKYHWMLLHTGSTPPKGNIYHATDENRRPLDLFRQVFTTSSGMLQSKSVVVALFVCQIDARSADASLDWASKDSVTGLMDPRALPRGERQWTCRVWVKTVLQKAANQRYIQLAADLETIEAGALATADQSMGHCGRRDCKIVNSCDWMRNRRAASAGRSDDPMEVDGWGPGYGGPKPMQGLETNSGARQGGSSNRGGSSKYKCKCGQKYDHKEDLKSHLKRHPNSRSHGSA